MDLFWDISVCVWKDKDWQKDSTQFYHMFSWFWCSIVSLFGSLYVDNYLYSVYSCIGGWCGMYADTYFVYAQYIKVIIIYIVGFGSSNLVKVDFCCKRWVDVLVSPQISYGTKGWHFSVLFWKILGDIRNVGLIQ